jgi:DNA-binding IclR family transcriptional regulator
MELFRENPAMDRKTSSTVKKAFQILFMIQRKGGEGVSFADVAEEFEISKSTAYRYLTTLEEISVIQRDERDRFHFGFRLVELTGAYLSNNDLRTESHELIHQLSSQTQETVHLAIPTAQGMVYIDRVDSTHSIRMASQIGSVVPFHSTALGKAILANYTPKKIEEIIQHGLPQKTSHTITSQDQLLAEIEQIRQQGFSIDNEENEIGVRCVGAPIFDYSKTVIGAISVSGPIARMDEGRCHDLGPLIREIGLKISARMGFDLQQKEKPAKL